MFTVLNMIVSRSVIYISRFSCWVLCFGLCTLNCRVFADNFSGPDLTFNIDVRAIEQSGVVRWFERKFPDLKQWAEELKHELKVKPSLFQSWGLNDEDFTSLAITIWGLENLIYRENRKFESNPDFQLVFDLNADKLMNLDSFKSWLRNQLSQRFGETKGAELLQIKESNQNQYVVSIPLAGLEDLPLEGRLLSNLDANLTLAIRLSETGTRIIAMFGKPLDDQKYFNYTDRNLQFNLLPDLPHDRQISFSCRLNNSISDGDSSDNNNSNPYEYIIASLSEVALGGSFLESSLLIESALIFSTTQDAQHAYNLWQGLLGMAQFAISQGAGIRSMHIPLSKIEMKLVDHKISISLDLNSTDLEEMVSSTLASMVREGSIDSNKKRLPAKTLSKAPDFSILLSDGKNFELNQQRGKVVVLNFWATWSEPSTRSLPLISQSIKQFPTGEIFFLAINQDKSAEIMTEFLSDRELNYLSAAFDEDLDVSGAFEVKGLPHTVVIDQNGSIRDISIGFSPFLGVDLNKELNSIIGNQ